MQTTIPVIETLSVSRHCMQDLLHHALISPRTFGLLVGRGSTIEAIVPVTKSADFYKNAEFQLAQLETDSLTLMGVYQATDSDGNVDPEQIFQLSSFVEKHSGKTVCFHLLLELSTEGRLDALMFADAEYNIPVPLDMLEN